MFSGNKKSLTGKPQFGVITHLINLSVCCSTVCKLSLSLSLSLHPSFSISLCLFALIHFSLTADPVLKSRCTLCIYGLRKPLLLETRFHSTARSRNCVMLNFDFLYPASLSMLHVYTFCERTAFPGYL